MPASKKSNGNNEQKLKATSAEPYRHHEESLLRPEIGEQAQFTKRMPQSGRSKRSVKAG